MKGSRIIQIVFIFLGLLLFVFPVVLQAVQIDSSMQEIESVESVEAPKEMTQKEINDLFGEDPYLGPTSYLQSPDAYSQREKSK